MLKGLGRRILSVIVQKIKIFEGEGLIEHWEKQCGKKRPRFCSVKCCPDRPENGAVVKKSDELFLIPICSNHSHEDIELDLVEEIPLVPFDSQL